MDFDKKKIVKLNQVSIIIKSLLLCTKFFVAQKHI